MSETECVNCGAVDEQANGVTIGLQGDLNTPACTICRANELQDQTVLSGREAEVAAYKQLTGATHQEIAERLELTKSTVDEYSRRVQKKVRQAATTTQELDEFL
jgi:DNA-binding NarL/FixJ family response regulator